MTKYEVTLYSYRYKMYVVEAGDEEEAANIAWMGQAGEAASEWVGQTWELDSSEEVHD